MHDWSNAPTPTTAHTWRYAGAIATCAPAPGIARPTSLSAGMTSGPQRAKSLFYQATQANAYTDFIEYEKRRILPDVARMAKFGGGSIDESGEGRADGQAPIGGDLVTFPGLPVMA